MYQSHTCLVGTLILCATREEVVASWVCRVCCLGCVPDEVVLGVRLKLLLRFKGETALTAAVFINVLLGYRAY